MEIQGKIIVALPEIQGTSKSSGKPWKKREYVLETHDQFPRKVHFDFFGDRADQYPLNVGDEINLSFDIESREYNGRWFTSIRGWKADKVDPNNPNQYPPQYPSGQYNNPAAGSYTPPTPPAPGPATTFPGGYATPANPIDLGAPSSDPAGDLPF